MESSDGDKELFQEVIEFLITNKRTALKYRELVTVWSELWDEEERIKRKEILSQHLEEEMFSFLEDIANREKITKDEYIERIESLLNEINDLQTNLEVAIPYEGVENLPLHNMAFHLNKKAEKYRVIKNERLNKQMELTKRETELCKKLDTLPADIQFSKIPKTAELQQFENHIASMEQEITNRSLILKEQSEKIACLFKELDTKPTLSFEREIITSEMHENFIYSNENMQRLDDLLTRLQHQVEDSKQTAEELVQKLNVMWDYLDESEEHRNRFLDTHSGHSIPIINALKEELRRCEGKKSENISKIVGKMRQVLCNEWDKCLISREEREKFRPYYLNCFTQDLLELHELEIERLRNYYTNNEQIFTLIVKHENLFKKLIELENTSKNANRYYNRGGQLLQEERLRKTITKELPIVEDELRTLLRKYEEDHGKPFCSLGVPMLLILDEQWNAHFDQKTIDKLARKMGSEKKKKTPLGKRTMATPGSSVASKISRLNPPEKGISSATKSVTPLAPARTVKARKKCFDNDLHTTFRLDTTYDEFQNDLQAKVESAKKGTKLTLRSTSVKDAGSTPARPALREKNTPAFPRSATVVLKTPPAKGSSAPMYSPSIRKMPKTLPRSTRRQNQDARLTPAVNRLPLII